MSDEEKSNAEESQKEEENPEPPLLVTNEQLVKGLSRIQRTAGKLTCSHALSISMFTNFAEIIDGSSYAFMALTMEETDPPVEDLGTELASYVNLEHLYLKQNGLRDIKTITNLKQLLTVNCSTNKIGSIKFLEEIGTDSLLFL